jgi:hypothetical protein
MENIFYPSPLPDMADLTILCGIDSFFLLDIYSKYFEIICKNKAAEFTFNHYLNNEKFTFCVDKILFFKFPECYMHPRNQRIWANFLVSLVNKGFKVFIATHSDYFLKEFNTLIMLNALRNNEVKHNDVLEKLNKSKLIQYSKDDYLAHTRVKLYTTGCISKLINGKKTKIITLIDERIDAKLGMPNKAFDEVIDDINYSQEIIYYCQ